VTIVEKSFTWKTLACACREGATPSKIVPQASACCAKSPNFSDFPGVDPAQQQVRLNVTGVLISDENGVKPPYIVDSNENYDL